ncbi:MAG: alanine racemase [bacterium]
MTNFSRPTWVEIRLDYIGHNIKAIKEHVGPQVKLMAVVKADAYGHGASRVSERAVQAGADWLGVASLSEAIELRDYGIKAPLLILGATPAAYAKEVLENRVTPTVFEPCLAKALSIAAVERGEKCKVHIKVDTGMGRLGVIWEEAPKLTREIAGLPGIEIEGLFSHLATADEPAKDYVRLQLTRFYWVLNQLEEAKIHIPIKHMANSAGAIDSPFTRLNLVRPGIATYGLPPAKDFPLKIDLYPAMSFKTQIIQLKWWPSGSPISYGGTYRTNRPARVATLPVGYADGYNRELGNKAYVLIGGQRLPVIGRVCMDFSMVDVTSLPEVREGDEVVLFGSQGKERIPVEEIAELCRTINYEIVSRIGGRIPRVYVG